jgi:beta-glucosidase
MVTLSVDRRQAKRKAATKLERGVVIRSVQFLCAASALSLVMAAPLTPVTAAPATGQSARPLYKDASAPIEARVDDLLARMTLDEKIAQITTVWTDKVKLLDAQGELDPSKLGPTFPNGIGHFTRPSDGRGSFSPRVVPGRDPRRRGAGQRPAEMGDDADPARHPDPVP